MSLTSSNNTNATVPAEPNMVAASNTTDDTRAQNNATASSASAATKKPDDSVMTLLTFGPLASCLTLPNLTAVPLPGTYNLSNIAQQEKMQAWFTQLPTTFSCTSFAWRLRPDYSEQLSALADFQTQLQQLFSPNNSTLASEKTLEQQPVASSGSISNTSSTINAPSSTAAVFSTTLGGNGTFFGASSAQSTLLGLDASGVTPPTGLPVWIGVVLACTALVHLLALLLHVCSDLDVLCPSLAAKLHNRQTGETVLPRHTASANVSSETLVDTKTKPAATLNTKTAEPPSYAEPVAAHSETVVTQNMNGISEGLSVTPPLIRLSRKAKRLVVPMMLLSALGTIAVAVVLNAKFAVGPVTQLPNSATLFATMSSNLSSAPSAQPPTWNSNTSSVEPGGTVTTNVRGNQITDSKSTNTTPVSAPLTAAKATNTNTTLAVNNVPPSTSIDASSVTMNQPAKPTLTKRRLVPRQTDFFPAASSTPDTTKLSNSDGTKVASPSQTNALLFPPTSPLTSLATPPPTASPSVPASLPTTGTHSANANTSTSNASENPSLFAVVRGASMHRLWWIVMLDLLLWFIQRRRTRSQTLLDRARNTVLGQVQVQLQRTNPSVVQDS